MNSVYFAMPTQSGATQAVDLLMRVGYDASYVGRRTGISGHIVSVPADLPGDADEVRRLVQRVDADAQLLA